MTMPQTTMTALCLVLGLGVVSAAGPKKVVYIDTRGYPAGRPQDALFAAADAGYTAINMAFYTTTGPLDLCLEWSRLNHTVQEDAIAQVHAKGALAIVSAGGAFDIPWTKMDGKTYGTNAAQFALDNHLDGVDFDLENLQTGFIFRDLTSAQILDWLSDATTAARAKLGPKGVITHAPQAPYFGKIGQNTTKDNPWTGPTGGYTEIYKRVGDQIDWFNVQFYNQGVDCYTAYDSLFVESNRNGACPDFPGTSISEIHAYGIPLEKMVIGKYVCHQGGNGGVAPKDFCTMQKKASGAIGWDAGLMVWEWMPGDCTPDSAAYLKQAYDC